MKKSKFYLLSGFLGLIATSLIVSSLASAHVLDGQFLKGQNIDPERQQAMQTYHDAVSTALENGDYNAWKETVDSVPRITDVINADNFDQFVQMHNYMQDGDFEAAQEIRAELGLDQFGPMMGMGSHRGGFNMEHKLGRRSLEE